MPRQPADEGFVADSEQGSTHPAPRQGRARSGWRATKRVLSESVKRIGAMFRSSLFRQICADRRSPAGVTQRHTCSTFMQCYVTFCVHSHTWITRDHLRARGASRRARDPSADRRRDRSWCRGWRDLTVGSARERAARARALRALLCVHAFAANLATRVGDARRFTLRGPSAPARRGSRPPPPRSRRRRPRRGPPGRIRGGRWRRHGSAYRRR